MKHHGACKVLTVTLSKNPSQRQLARRAALLPRDRAQRVDEPQVVREVLLGEARVALAPVAVVQVAAALDGPRQEAAPQGRVRHDLDAEPARRREEARLR